MACHNDGLYDMDNFMAFGSHTGAEISTVYHTFVATCKMKTLSFRKFLKEYFTAVMQGRTDYENLTPHFIGKNN